MKKSYKLTVFLIPIGIAVNFIGGQIILLLKLPLYLDSVGTIVVGALCGGIPGAIVGAISNALNAITNPTTLAYIWLNILFGLLAGFLAKKGVFRSLWKTMVASIGFALIGGGLGSTITILMFGGLGAGATGAITGMLMTMGFSVQAGAFISELFADLLDKIPTMIIVFFILKSIPVRTLVKLPQGNLFIQQNYNQKNQSI
jgi:energy-coupling factor transport system substrate-specific component